MEDSSDRDYNVFTSALDLDVWYHIVGTYDQESGAMNIYVDGTLVDSKTYKFTQMTTVRNFSIGYGDSGYFDGVIDEVRIYDRALTAEEVKELYGEDDNSLLAYYPFNGNANDESGNGNNGVVSGATLVDDRLGNTDSAYYFNGTSDYISIAASSSLVKGVKTIGS